MELKHIFAPPASFKGVRRLVLFFVVILVVVALVGLWDAHSRTVDVLSFTPPAGWETTQVTGGSMTMSHVDQAKDLSCQITVYTSRPSSGDLLADFFSEWTAIIGSPFPEAGELSEEKARIVGVALALPVLGRKSNVHLISYAAGAKIASIELVTPTLAAYESYRPKIEAFLASVIVNSSASGTPPIDAGQQAQEAQQEHAQASGTNANPTPQTERGERSALPSSQDDPVAEGNHSQRQELIPLHPAARGTPPASDEVVWIDEWKKLVRMSDLSGEWTTRIDTSRPFGRTPCS